MSNQRISVVCPFYNESSIIENAAKKMIENLKQLSKELNVEWELIAVNDGSTDQSLHLLDKVFKDKPNSKIISYPYNQGRGYALKKGIDAASGDIIVTTEIDLSWGDTIVKDITQKFLNEPQLDVVIASPNLPGGGYKNVSFIRVTISKIGNKILRSFFTKKVTMNTGMTRGYRREVIQNLPTDQKGKEFHLEVLLKLLMLGYRVDEIPAFLEWKDKKLSQAGVAPRKSSSKLFKIILSHLYFAIFANPIRYFWAFALCLGVTGLGFLGNALNHMLAGIDAIYTALAGFFIIVIGLLFFGFGIISNQNNHILQELWKIRINENKRLKNKF